MLGRKLLRRLLERGHLRGERITNIDLVDLVQAPLNSEICTAHVADLSCRGEAEALVDPAPDVVFHLAAVVSAEAETDFDKGMAVNLDATRLLFEALRRCPVSTRVVYASSIAVFGAPNAATSGFFSSIIREPLNGLPADLPVLRNIRHPHASPRAAVGFLLHAAELDTAQFVRHRNLTMPAVSVTVAEQIEALSRVAGSEAATLINDCFDPAVAEIVTRWPSRFETTRANALGFVADESYDDIIQAYIKDDLH